MKPKIYVKKIKIILILIVCSTLSMCGCKEYTQETNLILNESIENGKLITNKKINENNFFFKDISEEIKYSVKHSFSGTIPFEISLQVSLVSRYKEGKLYMIKCDFAGDFPERYEDGIDRLSLGYFYVQDNGNTIYRIHEEDMTDELMNSEKEVILLGTVVCQEEEKKDILGEEERGWHEWITTDDDQREYNSYNDLTGTGFYERFVWERGHGLIYYTSGFGAEKNMLELTIKD